MIIKKCTHCNNNIRIRSVKFMAMNDYGGIIVECRKCRKSSYLKTINPAQTAILKGAKKIEIWDDEITSKEEVIEKYDGIKELSGGLLVIGDLEAREYQFNFEAPHIYHCSSCKKEIESLIKSVFVKQTDKIAKEYNSLMNFILANSRHESENLVVELDVQCSCGNAFTSYFHKKFQPDGKPIDPERDLHLIGTNMPILKGSIEGIMSKNDCKIILEKFIIRWNAIYPRLLIATPFVGHQWLSKEEIVELWNWIKNFLDPKKSTLVTRTSTYKKYKEACHEAGISLDLLEEYGLNNPIIQDFTKKQDFHAKIYSAYSTENVEMLLGSFNLMDGPSVENISFQSIDYKTFTNRFVNPMNIPIVNPTPMGTGWLRIYQELGAWKAFWYDGSNILNKIMTYE